MTPPRPPHIASDSSALEALREQALIEEARRRARRRRIGYAAVALATVGAAVTLGLAHGGTTAAPTGAASARPVAHLAVPRNGRLAFQAESGALELVDPDGSGGLTIRPCRPGRCTADDPAWSPDGSRIAFLGAWPHGGKSWPTLSVYVAGAAGRHPRKLADCGSCGTQWGARLGWSPDGGSIVFSRDAGPRGQQSLWIVAATGGTPRRLTRCPSSTCVDVDAVWSPDGRELVFSRGGVLFTIHPDGSDLTQVGAGLDPRWSPDGRRLAYDGRSGIIVADGSRQRVLFAQRPGYGPGVPAWSPDGRRIVFFNTPGSPGHFRAEVWTMRTDGSAPTRLYRSRCCVGNWAAPVWSPDGRLLAFSADSAGGVYVMRADGSGLRRLSRAFADALSWQALPPR